MDNKLVKKLVDKVAENTSGTEGDPITKADVEKVVRATLAELRRNVIYKPIAYPRDKS